jgi:squalene-hopene/tetraprenyl-beta-curcumene cyclase
MAFILLGTFAPASGEPKKANRQNFQYLAGEIQIPLAREDEPVRATVSADKALAYLEAGAVAWQRERGCISCHTNGTYLFARPALTDHFGPPAATVRTFFERKLVAYEKEDTDYLPAEVVYLAAGLAADDAHVNKALTEPTRRALHKLFAKQDDDGAWKWPACWPPLEDSRYHGATVAAMAVATAPGYLEDISDPAEKQGLEKLTRFLRTTKPANPYEKMLLLWAGSRFTDLIDAERKKQLIADTLAAQRPDGGWSLRTSGTWDVRRKRLDAEPDRENPPSDGHATGLAITVLREAGVSADHKQVRRGVGWLKTNQRRSGRWWTRSLNTDKYSFITYSGTAYSLLALHACDELPTAASE